MNKKTELIITCMLFFILGIIFGVIISKEKENKLNSNRYHQYIEKEILKATQINMNNVDQIMSKPLRHKNLKED